jgi:heme exporter protein C
LHYLANPTRFLRIARPLTFWLGLVGSALLIYGCYAGLFLTPPDYMQGETVRIMYVHVPAAWLGMAGWSAIAVSSIVHLVWRHPLSGIAARAIAVPGAIFTLICLATGSIWGRPTWGTWWEWDGRMTSMLVLLFLYFGYIALANADHDRGDANKTTAIFGIVGAVNIPVIHGSVIWWKSLHQPPSITMKGSAISGSILWPLGFTMAGFTLIFAAIILMRMRTSLALTKKEARFRRMTMEPVS